MGRLCRLRCGRRQARLRLRRVARLWAGRMARLRARRVARLRRAAGAGGHARRTGLFRRNALAQALAQPLGIALAQLRFLADPLHLSQEMPEWRLG